MLHKQEAIKPPFVDCSVQLLIDMIVISGFSIINRLLVVKWLFVGKCLWGEA